MTGPFLLCARQELVLAVRSRWTQIFSIVFAALALAVAGSGYVLSGGAGVQDFSRVSVSLVQIVLLLVPLTALLLGVPAIASDRGTTEMLYSQPVSRSAILLGQLSGLWAGLAAAQLVGFGAAGLVVFADAGEAGSAGYALLVLGSLALTAIFLGVAALIGAGATGRRRARAQAIALVVWFVLVLLYDVAALGLASLLGSGSASRLLISASLANPIDAVRTAALLGMDGTAAFGPASLALLRFTHGPLGAGLLTTLSIAVWIVVPTILAMRRLSRADL
jgi:Cu-processing system permease protein